MMQLSDTAAHKNILAAIRASASPVGVTALRADDKEYHDDLFYNVLTYIYGCEFGIAVFERLEADQFNPNVALEVGYMFALRKPVCLLKDKTLQTDLVGKVYRPFDTQQPGESIPAEVTRWMKDKGLTGG